jgi:D-aminopeptidase
MKRKFSAIFIFAVLWSQFAQGQTEVRPRARDLGIRVGVLSPRPLNAITDVAGVRVGHTTLIKGDNIRTGVTAVLPHGGKKYNVVK